uniref:Uncharacterized protein n=1 Tax=Arundo donax TaxID=35708 RepID=A0A0A9FJ22_ARUDO
MRIHTLCSQVRSTTHHMQRHYIQECMRSSM